VSTGVHPCAETHFSGRIRALVSKSCRKYFGRFYEVRRVQRRSRVTGVVRRHRSGRQPDGVSLKLDPPRFRRYLRYWGTAVPVASGSVTRSLLLLPCRWGRWRRSPGSPAWQRLGWIGVRGAEERPSGVHQWIAGGDFSEVERGGMALRLTSAAAISPCPSQVVIWQQPPTPRLPVMVGGSDALV